MEEEEEEEEEEEGLSVRALCCVWAAPAAEKNTQAVGAERAQRRHSAAAQSRRRTFCVGKPRSCSQVISSG